MDKEIKDLPCATANVNAKQIRPPSNNSALSHKCSRCFKVNHYFYFKWISQQLNVEMGLSQALHRSKHPWRQWDWNWNPDQDLNFILSSICAELKSSPWLCSLLNVGVGGLKSWARFYDHVPIFNKYLFILFILPRAGCIIDFSVH